MDYECRMAPAAWDLFWTYVELCPGEVGCFGYVEHDPEYEELYVPEIFLVPQESDSSQVDFIEDGLPFAIEKALADDKVDKLRFCIHSHGTHGAFWSSTDEDMIKKIGSTGTPWFVSAIFNKKGESTCRLDVFDLPPFGKFQVTIKDIPIVMDRDAGFLETCIADLEKYVHKPVKNEAPKPVVATSKSKADEADDEWHELWAEICKMNPKVVWDRSLELLTPGDVIDVRELADMYDWDHVEHEGTHYFWNDNGGLELDASELVITNAAVVEEESPLTASELAREAML